MRTTPVLSRRSAIKTLAGISLLKPMIHSASPAATRGQPLALTMWDFSWLERRCSGAGYEDWNLALDELGERGYNAVRIDAYPHLVSVDPTKSWELVPVWNQHDWGAPGRISVQVQPALNTFIAKCRDRGIRVGLSSWFREDTTDQRMRLTDPHAFAEAWIATLQSIADAGLMDAVFYVDLCNEWPGDIWAPYFKNDPPELTWGGWYTDVSMAWMRTSIEQVRSAFPDLPLCYSFDGSDDTLYGSKDVSFFDLIEHHCWVMKENDMELSKALEYDWDRFTDLGYQRLAANADRVYAERPNHWQELLTQRIESLAAASRRTGLPMATSECWAIINYKDWPGLDWGWVKELCALGTITAAQTGRWAYIATSNFCGPQFVGMWRDVAWHQRLTQAIKTSTLDTDLQSTKLVGRLAG